MILNISYNQAKGIENGVYYFDLDDYPNISAKEMNRLLAFINYEESYGRKTDIRCKDNKLLASINKAISHEVKEKTYMPDTVDFVYHGTCINATGSILSGGNLLSAVKVSGKSGEDLAYEKRNSLWNDPPDYFEHIMFCNGDDMTGDHVVLSENSPSEDDLHKGRFNAGVRFYFRYQDIIKHPGFVFDGYHPVKVKDEIVLLDYLYVCIVPEQYKEHLYGQILPELEPKVYYIPQKNISISDWNKMFTAIFVNYKVKMEVKYDISHCEC